MCGGADAESNAYIDMPFSSHVEYVGLLIALSKSFPGEVGKRGRSDRTLLDVLQYGASHKHYVYLQNGATYLSRAEPAVRKLIPTGTTANRYTPLTSHNGSSRAISFAPDS